RFMAFLNCNSPDHIISATFVPNVVSVIGKILKRRSYRSYISQHGLEHVFERRLRKIFSLKRHVKYYTGKFAYRFSDCFISVSSKVLADMENKGFKFRNSMVIHNPVWDEAKYALSKETPAHPWLQGDG